MDDTDIRLEAIGLAQRARSAGFSQKDIAKAVSSSQSQVSRVLSGKVARRSRLFNEICIYVNNVAGGVSPETVRGNEELMQAVASVWDGSAHQAIALARVIRSLGGLTQPIPCSATSAMERRSERADS